ncbi:MAG: tetratricopeptide repeat protein [Bacteroides sp.]|nr:tetratricopeptide repeat protein [Bacteroides sp.]
MKKSLLLFLLCILPLQWSVAQAPKWVERAKRAVFSVVTYDKEDNMLRTGNGFFVTEEGVALSDFSLFEGAQCAVIITSEGKQMNVDAILGANSIYDVIKFRVSITDKRVPALQLAGTIPAEGDPVYLLPYSTQKDKQATSGKVKEVSIPAEGNQYYTLDLVLAEKMVSCPVTNATGEVFGIVQKATGADTTSICYAASASFAYALSLGALSQTDVNLRGIGIKKGLPETEEEALVALFMASGHASTEEYLNLVNDFISQFPQNADGYMRRATHYIYNVGDEPAMNLAATDLERALQVAQKKDDVYYNRAKLIYNYQLGQPEKNYKDWTYERALAEVQKAFDIDPLPVYKQLEGDIRFAMQDYAGAFAAYDEVNRSNLVSPTTFFSAAKAKEMMGDDPEAVIALLDSCVAHCPQPMLEEDAVFLLERAQAKMNALQYRPALLDYDAYYNAVRGRVNDVFYYYREQAALQGRQFQRALDDILKAIELNPTEVIYRAEYGAINLRVGRYEEAINGLQEALKIDPEYGEAYRLIGLAQVQLGHIEEACTSFSKAKELGDEAVDALIEKNCP